jgi:putative FmdB family regulatory protein
MPSYDYKCKECGYTFEEFQTMKAELLVVCPSCGKPALKRLMAGGVGMIFKGSGFYSTDYRKKGSSSSSSTPSTTDKHSSTSDKKSNPPPKPESPKSEK